MADKHYLSKEDYDTGISLMVRFCLDFAVVQGGKVLLSKRLIQPFKGLWHLPGGMVRKGESVAQAAERILVGELGLKAKELTLAGYVEYLDEPISEKGISTHSVSLVFKTTLEEGKIKGSFQAKEMEFFSEIPPETIPPLTDFLQSHWQELVN